MTTGMNDVFKNIFFKNLVPAFIKIFFKTGLNMYNDCVLYFYHRIPEHGCS